MQHYWRQRWGICRPAGAACALLYLVCLAQFAESATVRFSTFNVSLNRPNQGDLIQTLSTPDDQRARSVAEIIQRTEPDVILLNEFDYDRDGTAVGLFQENYLGISQNGQRPFEYPYVFNAASNTGIPSGFDLDNNGQVSGGNDAFGFGDHPGQYGMVLLSKYPMVESQTRTFQDFLWKDMPRALLPDDVATPQEADWYSDQELDVLRLSSKSHWDVVVEVGGQLVHVLAAHPTPPVFDGSEDRNGRRNHDEIRFWADYIDPASGPYIVDDRGVLGGLEAEAPFVILGDYNADPVDGDSTEAAILQLLDSPLINTTISPVSQGGADAASRQGGNNTRHAGDPAEDTADFGDRGSSAGNLRVDYVLPSWNLPMVEAAVFWPPTDDPLATLNIASDHHLVYADVVVPEPSTLLLLCAGVFVLTSIRCMPRGSAQLRNS